MAEDHRARRSNETPRGLEDTKIAVLRKKQRKERRQSILTMQQVEVRKLNTNNNVQTCIYLMVKLKMCVTAGFWTND